MIKFLQSRDIKPSLRDNWATMHCPFHNDSHPSLGINLDTGGFYCFSCHAKGSFPRLVAKLDGFPSIENARQYMIEKYGQIQSTAFVLDEPIDLDFMDAIVVANEITILDEGELTKLQWRHPYLASRGISEPIQRAFDVGYDRAAEAITLPWRTHAGELVTIKYRSVRTKQFWYQPSIGNRVRARLLFGFDKVLKRRRDVVAITEAEIDCLSVWQVGITAMALGGNRLTPEQMAAIQRYLHADTTLVIATDNDEGGELASAQIVEALAGRFCVRKLDWSAHPDAKDANDLDGSVLADLIAQAPVAGLPIV